MSHFNTPKQLVYLTGLLMVEYLSWISPLDLIPTLTIRTQGTGLQISGNNDWVVASGKNFKSMKQLEANILSIWLVQNNEIPVKIFWSSTFSTSFHAFPYTHIDPAFAKL